MVAKGFSVGQLLLGYCIRNSPDSAQALELVKATFSKPDEIPSLDTVSKEVFTVMYSGGVCDLAGLDMRTSGKYHDSVTSLLGESIPKDWEPLYRELVQERDRNRVLLAIERTGEQLSSGKLSPYEAADHLKITIDEVLPPPNQRAWDDRVDESILEMKKTLEVGVEFTSGVDDLDACISWRRSNLVTVGAGTSHGKTAFCTHLVKRAASKGLRVSYLCFEDYHVYPFKFAAAMYGVPLTYFTKYNTQNKDQRERAETALEMAKGYRDKLAILPPMKLSELEGHVKSFKPDVLILDYLQKYAEAFGTEDKRNSCGKATSDFQDIVRKYHCYGILCSQLRRRDHLQKGAGPARRPALDDLKESGDIENYSDSVALLWWPWKDASTESYERLNMNEYHINVAKDKLSMGGDVKCRFMPDTLNFTNLWSSDAQ